METYLIFSLVCNLNIIEDFYLILFTLQNADESELDCFPGLYSYRLLKYYMGLEQFQAWEGIPVGLLLFSPTIPSWKVTTSQILNETLLPFIPSDNNYVFITLTRACGSSSDDTELPYQ